MVLKPQLQELLSKQYLKRPWESFTKNSDLMLAVVWVTPDTLFLTDGILTIQTSHSLDLQAKFKTEKGFDVQLKDLEGFVCLFENCRIEITNGDLFQRPEEGELAGMFRKKNFREEAKRGDIDGKGKTMMRNLEQGGWTKAEVKFDMVNRTVIDLENEGKKKGKRITKRITKKKNKKAKAKKTIEKDNVSKSKSNVIQKNEDLKVNPVINFYLNFDNFNIICPYGKYFLTGKREMMVDSLSYEKIQFFERKFKLEKHIKKMKDPKNNTFVPVLELGDIIDEIHSNKRIPKKNNVKDEIRTTTSTPGEDLKPNPKLVKNSSKLRNRKRRSKRKRRV